MIDIEKVGGTHDKFLLSMCRSYNIKHFNEDIALPIQIGTPRTFRISQNMYFSAKVYPTSLIIYCHENREIGWYSRQILTLHVQEQQYKAL